MEELYEFARSHDFFITDLTPDGKIRRFNRNGDKNAWYIAWQIYGSKSGQPYFVMILGDWKTQEKFEYKGSKSQKLSREDQALIRQKIKEASEKAERERLEKQEEVAIESKKFLSTLSENFDHAYFKNKKLSRAFGALFTIEDNEKQLVIPCRDIDGKIWGYQKIPEKGKKYFLPGQRAQGTFHVIGDEDDETIYMCEGFATGGTIHMATGKTVFVCFSAANLVAVAKDIRKRWTNKTITVCGDDDFLTEKNVGRKSAEEAARICLGTAVFPHFQKQVEGKTDFNDLHELEGLETVKTQLVNETPPEPQGFYCLGFLDSRYFFLHKRTNSIKVLSHFSSAEFFSLMPIEYWEACYPGKKGINWDEAKSNLITQSNVVGHFDPLRVRGAGVWLDQGRVIVNQGVTELKNSKFVYLSNKNRFLTEDHGIATVSETRHLVSCCESLKWHDPNSGRYLAGWLAVARIAGALPIRPHVWLTGPSGSGKSTVMERVIAPALGHQGGRLYIMGSSTEAGIRQAIRADSLPLIFDEFESTGEHSKQRIESIVELLRSAWSATAGHIIKGSSGGVSSLFSVNCAALVSSIRTALTNDADRSRFAVLELEAHSTDQAHWNKLRKELDKIDERFGERLFKRQIQNVQIVMENFELLSERLARIVNQRYGQQYGMLLAGYASLCKDTTITPQEADALIQELKIEREQADIEPDELSCLNWLLDYTTTFYADVGGEKRVNVRKSINQVIQDQDSGEIEQLKSIGVWISEDYKHIYIANKHAILTKSVYGGTRWENCFCQTLRRLPGAMVALPKRFGTRTYRPLKIPLLHPTC